MSIGIKLIALFLAISLIPLGITFVVSSEGMGDIGEFSEDESEEELMRQMEDRLQAEVDGRQNAIQNIIDAREADAITLSNMGVIENYLAANEGEMDMVQELSEDMLGYMATEMRAGIDSAAQAIAQYKYGEDSVEDVDDVEALASDVEELISGTEGDLTDEEGTMYDAFQPGYLRTTGYTFIVNTDAEIVTHFDLEDGTDTVDDLGLDAFEEIAETAPQYTEGTDYGVAEYMYPDETQEGDPEELKFVSYNYYEPFDWVIAPSVYYYELQEVAVEDAAEQIASTFVDYETTRTIDVDDEPRIAYEGITFADAEGMEIVSAADGEVTTDQTNDHSTEEWFIGAMDMGENEVFFSEVYGEPGEQSLDISIPVFYDGEIDGVISITFDYSILTDMASQVDIGEEGYLFILDDEGITLSHPNEENIGADATAEFGEELGDIVSERMIQGETGVAEYTFLQNGEEIHNWASYTPIDFGHREYVLSATIPQEEATGPAEQLAQDIDDMRGDSERNLMIITAIAGIGVVVVGFFSSNYFANPIKAIKNRAQKLAKGDFSSDEDVRRSNDEIGDMVEAFDEMKGNLNTSMSEIKNSMSSLASGDLDSNVDTRRLKGEYKELGMSINKSLQTVRTSITEIEDIMESLVHGDLDDRVETSELSGEFRVMGEDVNESIEKIDSTLERIDMRIAEIEEGDFTRVDLDDMEGKYKETGKSINNSIVAIEETMDDFLNVMEGLAAGELDNKIDEDKHEGEFREMAYAINESMDNIRYALDRIEMRMAEIEEGDFARVDTSHSAMKGHYLETGEAVNRSLETIEETIGDLVSVMKSLAEGDLDVGIDEEDHEGQFREMAEAINTSLEAVKTSMEEVSFVMNGLAEGDLTKRAETSKLKGAYENIANIINQTMEEDNDQMLNIRNISLETDDAAEQIAASSEELSSTAENVSTSVQNISEGTSEQARMAEDMKQQMESVAANMEETSASVEDIAASAEEVSAQTDEGTEQANIAKKRVLELKDTLETTKEKAFELDGQSDEIGEVIETISNIAEQTNLLALNAAIEAARAGEHGKGFAVVADSVRELAEETQKETENIKEIIEKTQINASDVVDGVKEVTDKSDEVNEVTENNLNSLEEIREASDSVSSSIQDISGAVEDVTEKVQKASQQINNIAEIADQNSNEAESSAAAAEEQNASVEELSSSAQQLSSLGNQLSEMVNEYKMSEN